MSLLTTLHHACFAKEPQAAHALALQHTAQWASWLLPITAENPLGDDPSYHDDFERIREEVNKLSGADTDLICTLAETLLTQVGKDLRVVTYYCWARLQKEGEKGLAQSLGLLAALLVNYHETLLPARTQSRKTALEWLASGRVLDALLHHPEVEPQQFASIVALLLHIDKELTTWPEAHQPELTPLFSALENRFSLSGGADALVPQNISRHEQRSSESGFMAKASGASTATIQSGRELLEEAKRLADYLRQQPHGWLAAYRLMQTLRWDTLHQLPPQNQQGCTRLSPPRTEARVQLKRLYLQQRWGELAEQADRLFTEGVNHFWLDIQWYLHQALSHSPAPWDSWADVLVADLQQLLLRLPGLEMLAWDDGTPFADDVTLNWITQQVQAQESNALQTPYHDSEQNESSSLETLEQEALAQVENDSVESAMRWLLQRPDKQTPRQQWLLKLVMARVAEKSARPELALNLLNELNNIAQTMLFAQWEPDFLFEVKARQLQLLKAKSQRNTTDKLGLEQQMAALLAELTRLDPLRSLVLYS